MQVQRRTVQGGSRSKVWATAVGRALCLSHGRSTDRATDAHVYDDRYLSSVRPSVRASHCGTRQTLSRWSAVDAASRVARRVRLRRRRELRSCATKRANTDTRCTDTGVRRPVVVTGSRLGDCTTSWVVFASPCAQTPWVVPRDVAGLS